MKDIEVKDSILKDLNPSTKLTLTVIACMHILKNNLYPTSIIIILFMIIYIILGKISLKKIEKMLRPLYVITTLSLVVASLISKDVSIFIEPTVKLLLLFTSGILYAFTTTSSATISFFQTILTPLKCLKVPVNSIVLLLDTTLRFIPIVIEEAYRILNIQKLRTKSNKRLNLKTRLFSLKSFVIALFLQVFHIAQNIAQAIHIRQYSNNILRSKYLRNKLRFIDILLILLSISTLIII